MPIEFIQPGERLNGTITAQSLSVILSCWINISDPQDANDYNHRIINISDSGFSQYMGIAFDGHNNKFRVPTKGATSLKTGAFPSAITRGNWYHVLSQVTATALTAYQDGVKTVDVLHGQASFATLDKWGTAARPTSGSQDVDAKIRDACIWSGADGYTTTELTKVAQFLHSGGDPRMIQPDKIALFVEGLHDQLDRFGDVITTTGTPDLLTPELALQRIG